MLSTFILKIYICIICPKNASGSNVAVPGRPRKWKRRVKKNIYKGLQACGSEFISHVLYIIRDDDLF